MVIHTNHSALLEVYGAFEGAPWIWPKWRELTGVANFRFSTKNPKKIPAPLTPESLKAVRSYADAYLAIPSIEKRHEFASKKKHDSHDVGRTAWRTFIGKNWRGWKIQLTIHKVFAEEGITPIQVMVDNDDDILPSTINVAQAYDAIAFQLFGEDALTPNRKTSNSLMTRVRMQGAKIREELDDLANAKKPTIEAVRSLAKLVETWKRGVQVWNSRKNLDDLAEVEANLLEIANALGADLRVDRLKAAGRGKKNLKVDSSRFRGLAKSDEVSEVVALLEGIFSTDAEVPELVGPSDIPFGVRVDGKDPGVGPESLMSYENICSNLGLDEHGSLALFNEYSHPAATVWTKEGKALFDAFKALGDAHGDAKDFTPLHFHWHQIVALHSTLRQWLGENKDAKKAMGILCSDFPGLGKTRAAILIACWLVEQGMKQDSEKELQVPPIPEAESLRYFGAHKRIPNEAILIIAPGTLIDQWFQELHTLLKVHSVDILAYPSSSKQERVKFWSNDGIFKASSHRRRNVIIIANHSTLFAEYRLLYKCGKEFKDLKTPRKVPWESPPKASTHDANLSSTLYGQNFLLVIIDEAHFCRNPGPQHSAALEITSSARTHSRLILTATPLQTRPEDVGAMGRLCNIPHFSSTSYANEIAEDAADIRRARSDKEEDRIPEIQATASRRMQAQFGDALICRRPDSEDFEGNLLLDLPELLEVDLNLAPQPWEMEILSKSISDESMEGIALAATMGVQTESLYSNERLASTFPREDTKAPLPRINSRRQWKQQRKPTKLDSVARLTKYLLSDDNVPIPKGTVDGALVLPEVELNPKAKRKVLIFQEFALHMPVLMDVLRNVYKVKTVFINGSMPFDKRKRTIKEFKHDPKCRCLVFSKVGAVGLNLTEADVLIFLVRPAVVLCRYASGDRPPSPARSKAPRDSLPHAARGYGGLLYDEDSPGEGRHGQGVHHDREAEG
ncbi:hypothetical protein NMY22_g13940 [Coprinellus aureogranulatus]|nr:hypothetical protein NMY22_g13940 [Coprinellus aureogranulatus]